MRRPQKPFMKNVESTLNGETGDTTLLKAWRPYSDAQIDDAIREAEQTLAARLRLKELRMHGR